jgi:hypothetical protein
MIRPSAFSRHSPEFELDFSEHPPLQRIGRSAFHWSSLRVIVIPKTVRELSRKAFAYCCDLVKVDFEEPTLVSEIGSCVFLGARIDELRIPAAVSVIAKDAFDGCRVLECVVHQQNQWYACSGCMLIEIETDEEIAFFGREFCI